MASNAIDYRAVLEDIEAKIKKLQAAADAIREMISVTDAAPSSATANGHAVEVGAFFNMSIAEAIEKYLDAVKRPKTAAEIARALEEGGFPHTSKDFSATVRSAIFRELKRPDAQIVRRPDGDYGLAYWYPGLRSKPGRVWQEVADAVHNIADAVESATQEETPEVAKK
jgi:hypothetical protein